MNEYSVLMSVYKNDKPEWLTLAIESMLQQTIRCNQFVIVLDGPISKELHGVIDYYCKKDPDLFEVIPLSNNVGLGRALDVGLEKCRNELVARMDADDISLPQRCEKLLQLFNDNQNLSLAGTNIDEFYNDPQKIVSSRIVPSDYDAIKKFMRRRSAFNHPTVMFKKSEVIRCGGYGSLRRKQDYDLFSRMINMNCYALNIPESLLLFRSSEDNFKRRKSKEYVRSYIKVQKLNYHRKYCFFLDLAVVVVGQTLLRIMPIKIIKFLSGMLLRKRVQ